jgi:hypothetical protein
MRVVWTSLAAHNVSEKQPSCHLLPAAPRDDPHNARRRWATDGATPARQVDRSTTAHRRRPEFAWREAGVTGPPPQPPREPTRVPIGHVQRRVGTNHWPGHGSPASPTGPSRAPRHAHQNTVHEADWRTTRHQRCARRRGVTVPQRVTNGENSIESTTSRSPAQASLWLNGVAADAFSKRPPSTLHTKRIPAA